MGKTSVLVVEDDADISGIVAEHLGRAGYACTQAFSGTEARLVLEGARERGERFDVVVCDLMLPGLPGEDIVRLVRATDAATPIIVTSARSAASDKIDLLKLGADDYLAKPFDLDEPLAVSRCSCATAGDRPRRSLAATHCAWGSGRSTAPRAR